MGEKHSTSQATSQATSQGKQAKQSKASKHRSKASTPNPVASDHIQHHTDALFSCWLKEVEEEPQLKAMASDTSKSFVSHSKSLLHQLMHSASSQQLPKVEATDVQPFFKLWQDLLTEHIKKGMTLKSLALSIFSMKKSLNSFLLSDEVDEKSRDSFEQLSQILDFVGLFTFELYTAENEREIKRQQEHISYLQSAKVSSKRLVGNSAAMKDVYKKIGLILDNDISVVLQGETGTGKDVIAELIHENSKRSKGPFVVVNCGAIPKELVESELFGYEKGSFTGADKSKLGKFELANKGTLFLDEIGDLPLDVQVKLLRAIQNKEIEKVGSTERIKVDARIIAASHRDLKHLVQKGEFREDLYYRLYVYPIHIPPLRDRQDDILPLSEFFIEKFTRLFGLSCKGLDEASKVYLNTYAWPGNVRELENAIQKAIVLAQGDWIQPVMLQTPGPAYSTGLSHSTGYASGDRFITDHIEPGRSENSQLFLDKPKDAQIPIQPLDALEKQALIHALKATNNNIKRASDGLGISRTTFYNKAKKYGIDI